MALDSRVVASRIAMRNLRSTLAALIPGLLILVPAQFAYAQEEAAASGAGVCAPWHRCLAFGGLAIAVLGVLGLFLGYLIQRRGFARLEHRQGNPEGVPVEH